MPDRLKMAQWGTKHGHAKGVLEVMINHRDVEVIGVYEPDPERRRQLVSSGDATWNSMRWFDDPSEFLGDPSVVAVSSEGSNRESLGFTEQIVACLLRQARG